jgi:hypothetical protein
MLNDAYESIPRTAAILGVPERPIRQLVAHGRVPYRYQGQMILVSVAAVAQVFDRPASAEPIGRRWTSC